MQVSPRRSLRYSDRTPRALVRAACLLTSLLLIGSIAAAQSDETPSRPTFDVVTKSLSDYFKSLGDYQAGDLIRQSNVANALAHVKKSTGWEVPNGDALAKLALADRSFLVTQLATPNGRQFMRALARYAGAYSRLDRLSTISGGQKLIKDLISDKRGYTLIEYLATTPGGRNLGAMMAGAQKGVDLNKPTGRIYTADDLLARVQQAYSVASP